MPYCAIPPVDMNVVRVGRAYGMGWNRECGAMSAVQRVAHGCRPNQLHAGMDFMVSPGTPILAIVAGRVSSIGREDYRGHAGGLRGYGNAVVVETHGDIPGMPNPFWTLYAHMRAAPSVAVGEAIQAGKLLGYSGQTTNATFAGMPPHLHVEWRRRNYPSSYDRDTINPAVFWRGVGIDWVDSYRTEQRQMGGTLQIVQGGPSDCSRGARTTLSGYGLGAGYIDKASLSPVYASKGVTTPGPEVPDPPAYGEAAGPAGTPSSSEGNGLVWGAAAVLTLAAIVKAARRR